MNAKSTTKKILIAGSDGFIGSHLYKTLTRAGYTVHGLGNYQRGDNTNFSHIDLTDYEQTDAFVRQTEPFDALIFLVALAHSKGKGKDYPAFRKVNVQTLIHLMTALQKHDKLPAQIIFSSTISVYGERWKTTRYAEDSPLMGKTPYARTKIEAENYLLEHFKEHSRILRFAPVYAENFTLNIDRRTKIKNQYFRVGDGTKKLSLLNIKNISGTALALLQNNIAPGVYNLADAPVYTYNDLLRRQKAGHIRTVPVIAVRAFFLLGFLLKNNFLMENSIKLATDNVYPSDKIQQYTKLDYTLND